MKVNPAMREANTPSHIPKQKLELKTEDQRINNLDSVAKDILFKSAYDTIFSRIKGGKIAKEVWDSLMVIGEGDDQQNNNKLTVAYKHFEDFKMQLGESINDLEARFLRIITKIKDLENYLSQKGMCLKVLRGVPSS